MVKYTYTINEQESKIYLYADGELVWTSVPFDNLEYADSWINYYIGLLESGERVLGEDR
jgi:hypothetical protein